MVLTPKHILLFFTLVVISFSGCKRVKSSNKEQILVQVGDEALTKEELIKAIPYDLSPEDSTDFAQNYITRWVKSTLLLRKAELNLTPKEKDVEQILESYRASLLIHKYQQKLLLQKYSPLITHREIEEYYGKMKENFKLEDNIIQGVFIQVPLNAPKLNLLQEWYKSEDPDDSISLEDYCYQNAKKYENFTDKWVTVKDISKLLPSPIPDKDSFLKYRNYFEVNDSTYHYFVSIRRFHMAQEIAPLSYVEEQIKAILLNKKRTEFIKNLEEELYQEGIKQKVIKFY